MRLQQRHLVNTALMLCVVAFAAIFLYWLYTRTITLDDLSYHDNNMPILRWLALRFTNWSQRLFIDYTVYGILHINSTLLPKVVCGLVTLGLIAVICALFGKYKPWFTAMAVLLCGFQSYQEIEGAGYFTSIINFQLPLVLGLFAVKLLLSQEINGYKALLLFVSMLFATSLETVAFGMTAGLLVLYFYVPKHNRSFVTMCLVLCIFSIVLFYVSGATDYRLCVHEEERFPEYLETSVFFRGYVGLMTTLLYYCFNLNSFMLFLVITVIYALTRWSMIKMLVCAAVLMLIQYLGLLLNTELNSTLLYYRYGNTLDLTSVRIVLMFMLSAAVMAAVVYGIWRLKLSIKDRIAVLSMLAVGLMMRVGMGFSPTVFFSLGRTFIFTNFAFVLAGVFILYRQELISSNIIRTLIICCFVFCTAPRVAFMLSEDFKNFPTYPDYLMPEEYGGILLQCAEKYPKITEFSSGGKVKDLYGDVVSEAERAQAVAARHKRLVAGKNPLPHVFNVSDLTIYKINYEIRKNDPANKEETAKKSEASYN
ncbi:hypothetical protein [Succinivibrio dextrinosolvens]|uniref:hypothetical protein n=1 Tax=Succinivibrio dextrinosolvens TaxID=83771 RepID=UPI0019228F4F|nr:hypothetical protein [Succinivibrio dextrinosolvens]